MIDKIHVVIPYVDRYDLTNRMLEVLSENSDDIHVILIDNGSVNPVESLVVPKFSGIKFLRNKENTGCLNTIKQGLDFVGDDDLLIFMHNDVLVWEPHWDSRVRAEFDNDEKLGLAGFFGAPGVAPDGGRIFAHSNMIGKEWGTVGRLHGALLTGICSAAVLDSLCMMFRVKALHELGIPEFWPPHHWFDRLFCLQFIDNGWHVATIGIAFDHAGGSTGTAYNEFTTIWVKERFNRDMEFEEANNLLYMTGYDIFVGTYGHRLSLVSDGDYHYQWRQA